MTENEYTKDQRGATDGLADVDDWELATAGLKGTAKVPKRTLKRWEKEVAAWHDENDGKETA